MSLAKLKNELSQFEQDLQQTYEQLMMLVDQSQRPNHVYCYFDSSLILHTDQSDQHLIIVNFYVKNMSNEAKELPIILLQINCDEHFDASGKYTTPDQKENNIQLFWERIELDNLHSTNDYCFKPTELNQLPPNDQLSFQQFQITFPKDATLSVDGFVYFNESNDGVKSENRIDIQQ